MAERGRTSIDCSSIIVDVFVGGWGGIWWDGIFMSKIMLLMPATELCVCLSDHFKGVPTVNA
jgi:hypothetical protein